MHVFVVTYEFIYSPFSGNGILAKSLVTSLLEHGCDVTVWCARPLLEDDDNNATKDDVDGDSLLSSSLYPRLTIFASCVSKWRQLDDHCAFDEFVWDNSTTSCTSTNPENQRGNKNLKTFLKSTNDNCRLNEQRLIPIAIDWHGAHAFQSIPDTMTMRTSRLFFPLLYMNFRVYSAGIQDVQRHAWLDHMERIALEAAHKVVALSEHDRLLLLQLSKEDSQTKSTVPPSQQTIRVFPPPLRKDVHLLASAHSSNSLNGERKCTFLQHLPKKLPRGKRFVTCVVRLSPEKETIRFVKFVEQCKDLIQANGWVPVLGGSPSDPEYAKMVRASLKETFPDSIDLVDTFLRPEELCALFAHTVVNFHPCSYEAYGMTIVEAAAMKVPSIIASGGTVGASHLLKEDAFISVDMPPIKTDSSLLISEISSAKLQESLKNETNLQTIGKIARERALQWSEAAYGKAILDLAMSDNE